MAAKRRRRPSAAARSALAATPAPAPQPEAKEHPARPRRTRPTGAERDAEPRWSASGLLVLLTLALLVQVPVGAIVHLWSNSNPLALDLVFFQPQYVVLACFLVMPLAARLTGQARRLRLLESLSLGILYALLGLYISTALVHPSSDTQPTDQFIKHLQGSDYLLLALADVVALFGTVAVYPGLQRLVTAPGRRARARLAARGGAPAAPQPARTSGSSASAAPRGRRR